jgi:hypothetical protein
MSPARATSAAFWIVCMGASAAPELPSFPLGATWKVLACATARFMAAMTEITKKFRRFSINVSFPSFTNHAQDISKHTTS